jgi:hypothetical protein
MKESLLLRGRPGSSGRRRASGPEVRQNSYMPGVSLSVPIITAGAAVLGAAIPTGAAVIQDLRKARRDRAERRLETRDQACLDLLRSALDLRTQVANAYLSHGDEVIAGLREIRSLAASVEYHAVSTGMRGRQLKASAYRVAKAARILTQATERNTNLTLKEMAGSPDFTELDVRVEEFRSLILSDEGG